MSQADKLAKLQRDTLALRSRLLRIQGEADSAVRELRDVQTELEALVREGKS